MWAKLQVKLRKYDSARNLGFYEENSSTIYFSGIKA
jgi:hypothetical protein